jgi:hypothetical protein
MTIAPQPLPVLTTSWPHGEPLSQPPHSPQPAKACDALNANATSPMAMLINRNFI